VALISADYQYIVLFNEPDDRSRPPGCRDSLDGDEDDAGRGQRREEQPVEMEGRPDAIRIDEQPGDEDKRADDGEKKTRRPDARRDRAARGRENFSG
jgi:hypothetical protein